MFPADQPLEIDIGCGKGRFLLSQASKSPRINYIGIDRQLPRLLTVEKTATRENITNVRLLQIEAAYAMQYLLHAASVSVIYVLFPDPWPKRRHRKNRLFNQPFLDLLHAALKQGGLVHTATDNLEYAESILSLFSADAHFVTAPPIELTEAELSDFELTFRAQDAPIGRYSFRKK